MNILIFRTNMRSANDVEKISALLDGEARIRCWNVDREDIDCVLRIEAVGLECGEVIDWVHRADLECAELEGQQYKNYPIFAAMQQHEASANFFEEGQAMLIDKPLHWTSFDVVRKIRNLVRIKKVGHAGTLDPLATGLLILCTGKYTKRINDYMAQEKEYTGTITLGAVTPTFDLESEPEDHKDTSAITAAGIEEALHPFRGNILQVPPMHSAIKKDGKRLYELARKGQEVQIDPRPVTIKTFEISSIEMPVLRFRVVCSTGTYIRSLANDLGAALGCGGYLSSLCRTRIGEFTLDKAMSMEAAEIFIKEKLAGQKG